MSSSNGGNAAPFVNGSFGEGVGDREEVGVVGLEVDSSLSPLDSPKADPRACVALSERRVEGNWRMTADLANSEPEELVDDGESELPLGMRGGSE